MTLPNALPPDVQQALARGQSVEAVARLRAATGLSLAEAKAVIDAAAALAAGRAAPMAPPAAPGAASRRAPSAFSAAPGALPADVQAAIARGDIVEAIRSLRHLTGLDLRAAKRAVESGAMPSSAAPPASDGLSPGEVPRTSGRKVLRAIAVALAAIAAYWLLRR